MSEPTCLEFTWRLFLGNAAWYARLITASPDERRLLAKAYAGAEIKHLDAWCVQRINQNIGFANNMGPQQIDVEGHMADLYATGLYGSEIHRVKGAE